MATLQQHLDVMKNQADCMEEQGHLKQPDEFWALWRVQQAIMDLQAIFQRNGRSLNDD